MNRAVHEGCPHRELIDWLLSELEKRNWSMGEASRRAQLHEGAVSAIINGTQPGLELCKGLARAFDEPAELILRLAGHLPSMPAEDTQTEQAGHLIRQMPSHRRREALDHLRVILSHSEQQRNIYRLVAETRTTYAANSEDVVEKIGELLRKMPVDERHSIIDSTIEVIMLALPPDERRALINKVIAAFGEEAKGVS